MEETKRFDSLKYKNIYEKIKAAIDTLIKKLLNNKVKQYSEEYIARKLNFLKEIKLFYNLLQPFYNSASCYNYLCEQVFKICLIKHCV